MQDTSIKIKRKYQKMFLAKSPQERLKMGCAMFDMAKEIVHSAILNDNPRLSERKLKEKIFLRFYGHEFSVSRLKKIFRNL